MPLRMHLLLPVLLLGACSSARWFAPREQLNGTAPSGAPAALYPLADGALRRGELRVWSDGARKVDGGGVRVHIGFELENQGDQPLRLDPGGIRIQRLVVDGAVRDGDLSPERIDGVDEAAPGHVARVDCWFDPGAGVAAGQLDGFDLHWDVRTADGSRAWQQVTPFRPWAPEPYWYHDDPWYRGYWGYGPWGPPYRSWYRRHYR